MMQKQEYHFCSCSKLQKIFRNFHLLISEKESRKAKKIAHMFYLMEILFYGSEGNIYWVDAEFIERLKPDHIK
jgi:hypothetical protein